MKGIDQLNRVLTINVTPKRIVSLVPSQTNAKTIFVDAEMFSRYGSRLIKAFDYFKKLRNSL